ncbi:Carbamoyl-phosphate synthase small chain [Buchnera aphidicola (Pterocallis alni)]
MKNNAFLILENGYVLKGNAIGVQGITIGEIVFNTAMTGYQEILTDASYKNQIVLFTYPHIGNTGINAKDVESNSVKVHGIIIRNLSNIHSNYRSIQSLSIYLKKNNIIGISNIDTRKLTILLRDQGSQYGCILSTKHLNLQNIIQNIKNTFNTYTKNPIKHVCTKINYSWNQNTTNSIHDNIKKKSITHIIVYDFGVKYNIIRILESYNCYITIITPDTTVKKIISINPDGIILSNGPGDPRKYKNIINIIKKLITIHIPIFGICLGHQLLGLANNAKIIKMKFGHHGSNHPVQDLNNNKVFITTQNHNFTIDKNNLPKQIIVTHTSLFDNTIQGICIKKKYWGFQGHPEGNPGPHESEKLLYKFIKNIQDKKKNTPRK